MSPEQEIDELAKNYEFGPLWKEDTDRASAYFKVVFQDVGLTTSYVEAQSAFGTRYALFMTEVPYRVQPLHEANYLVSIVTPWPRTILLHLDLRPDLHLSYLREKIKVDGIVHGGDLMAVGLTIAEAWKLLKEKAGLPDLTLEVKA